MNNQPSPHGGMYVPETLIPALTSLEKDFRKAVADPKFIGEFRSMLKNFVGRETPLMEAKGLQKLIDGPRIFLKREDLNHTGSHKINNALGQCLLAKYQGKSRVIAETGAGQHGVATATACAYLNLPCEIYMGETDIQRQSINVKKMQLLGAKVIPVNAGEKTLKEAVNAALRDYAGSFEHTHYCLGSALGPAPYPEIVAYFQKVIGDEAHRQFNELCGRMPDAVIACIGGGSNAIGIFQGFIHDASVQLIGVEAGGTGAQLGKHAARLLSPKQGVLHGCHTYILQDDDGQIANTHSIAAGLDYPAIGPMHADLFDQGRATYTSVSDDEVRQAFSALAKTQGIIPALESAHAIAFIMNYHSDHFNKDDCVLINLSGRGDKDLLNEGVTPCP